MISRHKHQVKANGKTLPNLHNKSKYLHGKPQGLSVVVQETEGACGLFLQRTRFPCLPSYVPKKPPQSCCSRFHPCGTSTAVSGQQDTVVSSSCHVCLTHKYINKPYSPIALHQFHLSCYFYEVKTLEKGPEEMMKTHRRRMRCFSALGPQPAGLSRYIPADTAALNKAFVPSWWADAPNLSHLVLSRQICELELQILYGPIFNDLLAGSADGHA